VKLTRRDGAGSSGHEDVYFWVDPPDLSTPDPSYALGGTSYPLHQNGYDALGSDQLDTGFIALAAGQPGTVYFDAIRVGTTWADVVGQPPVPEPTGAGLIGLAILGLHRRR